MELFKVLSVLVIVVSSFTAETLQPDGKHVCSRMRTTEAGLEEDLVCCPGFVAKLVGDRERCVKEHRHRAAACSLPADPGPCGDTSHERWYFDTSSGKCQPFTFGGCGGNSNRFHNRNRCQKICEGKTDSHRRIVTDVEEEDKPVCLEPKKVGTCRAAKTRYYYDSEQGKCKAFIFGGCNGNKNNFETMDECQAACGGVESVVTPAKSDVPAMAPQPLPPKLRSANDVPQSTKPEMLTSKRPPVPVVPISGAVCVLEPRQGPCKAMTVRYYFDHTLGRCDQFTYGGCKGNSNNFLTMEDCHNICKDHIHDTCSKPADKGNCQGSSPRYFYDKTTGQCKEFAFTGCGGNKNNFVTKNDCEIACMFETIDKTRMHQSRARAHGHDQKEGRAPPGRKAMWWPAILVVGLVLVAAVVVGALVWRRKAQANNRT